MSDTPNVPSNDHSTDLTAALEEARKNPNLGNHFYDAFLNWNVVVPVVREDKQPPAWNRLGVEDRFRPLFIPQGELRVVPIFDDLRRLQGWSDGRVLDFLEIRAHLLLRILGAQVALSLNPGTPFQFLFSSELLKTLSDAMKPIQPS